MHVLCSNQWGGLPTSSNFIADNSNIQHVCFWRIHLCCIFSNFSHLNLDLHVPKRSFRIQISPFEFNICIYSLTSMWLWGLHEGCVCVCCGQLWLCRNATMFCHIMTCTCCDGHLSSRTWKMQCKFLHPDRSITCPLNEAGASISIVVMRERMPWAILLTFCGIAWRISRKERNVAMMWNACL